MGKYLWLRKCSEIIFFEGPFKDYVSFAVDRIRLIQGLPYLLPCQKTDQQITIMNVHYRSE